MNIHRTESILQRAPLILAVTAASYGLPRADAHAARTASPRRARQPMTGPAQPPQRAGHSAESR